MLVRALGNAASPDDPEAVISSALELASGEADALTIHLQRDEVATLLAHALEGRLRALAAFIDKNVEVTWKPGRGPNARPPTAAHNGRASKGGVA